MSSLTPTLSGVIVMDNEGHRIMAKYYNKQSTQFATLEDQLGFERRLHTKSHRANAPRNDAEVLPFEKHVVVYKFCSDVCFYVMGPETENELIVLAVLNSLEESLSNLLRGQVGRRTVTENLDLLLLAVDEIIDEGLILELDASLVTKRVSMHTADGHKGAPEVPLSEQTVKQAFNSIKSQFQRSFR